jgi:hypothetical protein
VWNSPSPWEQSLRILARLPSPLAEFFVTLLYKRMRGWRSVQTFLLLTSKQDITSWNSFQPLLELIPPFLPRVFLISPEPLSFLSWSRSNHNCFSSRDDRPISWRRLDGFLNFHFIFYLNLPPSLPQDRLSLLGIILFRCFIWLFWCCP